MNYDSKQACGLRFLVLLSIFSLQLSALSALNVFYTVTDFGYDTNAVKFVTLRPISRGDASTNLFLAPTLRRPDSWTNGTATFSNVVPGFAYQVGFQTVFGTTYHTNYFTNNLSGTWNGVYFRGIPYEFASDGSVRDFHWSSPPDLAGILYPYATTNWFLAVLATNGFSIGTYNFLQMTNWHTAISNLVVLSSNSYVGKFTGNGLGVTNTHPPWKDIVLDEATTTQSGPSFGMTNGVNQIGWGWDENTGEFKLTGGQFTGNGIGLYNLPIAPSVIFTNVAQMIVSPLTNGTVWVASRWGTNGSNGDPYIGKGAFFHDNTADATNMGTVFASTYGGRWKRVLRNSHEYDVTWFGAMPLKQAGNWNDATAAIQATIDAAPNGSTILFPPMGYAETGINVSNRIGITLLGDPNTFKLGNSFGGPQLYYIGATNNGNINIINSESCAVDGLLLHAYNPLTSTTTNIADWGINIDQVEPKAIICTDIQVRNCSIDQQVTNYAFNAIAIARTATENCEEMQISHVRIGSVHCGNGIYVGPSQNALNIYAEYVNTAFFVNAYYCKSSLSVNHALDTGSQVVINTGHGFFIQPQTYSDIRAEQGSFMRSFADLGYSDGNLLTIQNCSIADAYGYSPTNPIIRMTGDVKLNFIGNQIQGAGFPDSAQVFGGIGAGILISENNSYPVDVNSTNCFAQMGWWHDPSVNTNYWHYIRSTGDFGNNGKFSDMLLIPETTTSPGYGQLISGVHVVGKTNYNLVSLDGDGNLEFLRDLNPNIHTNKNKVIAYGTVQGQATPGFSGDASGLINGNPALATNNATATDGQALVKRGNRLSLETISVGAATNAIANTNGSGYGKHTFQDLRATNIGVGTLTVTNDATVNGTVTASAFSGVGTLLTSLNANNLVSGILPIPRLPDNYLSGLFGNQTFWDGSQSQRTLTFDLSGATDPQLNLANNSMAINVPLTLGVSITPIAGKLTIVADDGTTASLTNNSSSGFGFSTAVNAPLFGGSGAGLTALNASQLAAGTLPAGRFPALTGDVTTSAGSVATTISADAVTYAKMQNISVTQRALGRNSAGAGDPQEVTLSQMLDWIGSAAQGDILYRGASGWARLGAGTSGQFLETLGAGANPIWAAASSTAFPLTVTTQVMTNNTDPVRARSISLIKNWQSTSNLALQFALNSTLMEFYQDDTAQIHFTTHGATDFAFDEQLYILGLGGFGNQVLGIQNNGQLYNVGSASSFPSKTAPNGFVSSNDFSETIRISGREIWAANSNTMSLNWSNRVTEIITNQSFNLPTIGSAVLDQHHWVVISNSWTTNITVGWSSNIFWLRTNAFANSKVVPAASKVVYDLWFDGGVVNGIDYGPNNTNLVNLTILPNDATKYWDGTGHYTVPAGSGGGGSSGTATNVQAQTMASATNLWAGPTNDISVLPYRQFYKTLVPVSLTNISSYFGTNEQYAVLSITNASGSNVFVYTPVQWQSDDGTNVHSISSARKARLLIDVSPDGGTNLSFINYGDPQAGGSGVTGMNTNQWTTNVVGARIVGNVGFTNTAAANSFMDFVNGTVFSGWTINLTNGVAGVSNVISAAGWTSQSGISTNRGLRVNGTSALGGATTVDGNLTPLADNAYDFGGSSFRWRDIYLAHSLIGAGYSLRAIPSGGAYFFGSLANDYGLGYSTSTRRFAVFDDTSGNPTVIFQYTNTYFAGNVAISNFNGSAQSVRVGGTLKVNTTATGNVGGGEDDLITYSVPASTLGVNGDFLEYDVWGTCAANSNTKDIKVYFGATVLIDGGAVILNGVSWRAHGKIVRTGAATQTATCEMTVGGTLLSAVNGTIALTTTPAETLSGAITFKVTGTSAVTPADNDIVQNGMVLKWYPNQ